MFRSLAIIVTASIGGLISAQTSESPAHFKAVAEIVGRQGALNADGSFRINIPRTDIAFTNKNGMSIPADLGLATYIAMVGDAKSVLAVGDVAMIAEEIDFVIDRLRAGGFEIVSLHNHMTGEEPRLFFMHFQAIGNPTELAKTFRNAIDIPRNPVEVAPINSRERLILDLDALGAVFGVKAQVFPSGVLRFANPRKDIAVGVGTFKFLPGMGLGSWAALHACDCGLTMAMGDTCCIRSDLQQVIDALRGGGIHITAIHNHVFGAAQEVMFLHFEGEGDSFSLAKTVRSCWDVLGK